MNLSGQLRIILLLIGAVTLLAIYFFGKRRGTESVPRAEVLRGNGTPMTAAELAQQESAPELDEEELDTPAYMRRQPHHEVQFEEPLEDLPDEVLAEPVYAMSATRGRYEPESFPVQTPADAQREVMAAVDVQAAEAQPHDSTFVIDDEPAAAPTDESLAGSYDESADAPVFVQDDLDKFQMGDLQFMAKPEEPVLERVNDRLHATAITDEFENWPMPESAHSGDSLEVQEVAASHRHLYEDTHTAWPHDKDEPTIPSVSEVVVPPAPPVRAAATQGSPLSAQTPTLSESVSAPVNPTARLDRPATTAQSTDKPAGKTLSPAARRKIVALRLAMPERAPGSQLQALLHAERLEFGRFSIFHRTQGTGTVFSVASMVEPGTFDPVQMPQQQFPGITLFMLLPGPLDGLIAYDQMLTCAQRIAHATHGILQDERGNKLTPQIMERLRDEVLDFQHLMGSLPASS